MTGYTYALPAFLAGPAPYLAAYPAPMPYAPIPGWYGAPVDAWAPSPAATMAGLQQELMRLQLELDRLLASLAPPPAPAPTPSPGPAPAPAPTRAGPTRFVLSSFNILSSNAGKPKGYAPGVQRVHDVVRILRANDVSVVGLQEVDAAQLKEFKRVAGDVYGTFAGHSGKGTYHDTTIAWRKDQWKLEQQGTIPVPGYEGVHAKVPYVRLRNRQTGQEAYFVNAHNPADIKKYGNQSRYRDEAARREAAFVDRLRRETGLPVFMVGDLNAVATARDIFTKGAPLKAANPAGKAGIDWIFGTKEVRFDDFRRTREGLIGRTTDHPVVFSDVTIPARS